MTGGLSGGDCSGVFLSEVCCQGYPPPDNLLERLRFLMTYFPGYHCLNIKILANDIDFASVRIRMRIMVMVRITK